eukprot:COSAG01_NODE_15033_length_1382_cov_1.376461_2_plen_184_part_00
MSRYGAGHTTVARTSTQATMSMETVSQGTDQSDNNSEVSLVSDNIDSSQTTATSDTSDSHTFPDSRSVSENLEASVDMPVDPLSTSSTGIIGQSIHNRDAPTPEDGTRELEVSGIPTDTIAEGSSSSLNGAGMVLENAAELDEATQSQTSEQGNSYSVEAISAGILHRIRVHMAGISWQVSRS